jgi:hypothetical protein
VLVTQNVVRLALFISLSPSSRPPPLPYSYSTLFVRNANAVPTGQRRHATTINFVASFREYWLLPLLTDPRVNYDETFTRSRIMSLLLRWVRSSFSLSYFPPSFSIPFHPSIPCSLPHSHYPTPPIHSRANADAHTTQAASSRSICAG